MKMEAIEEAIDVDEICEELEIEPDDIWAAIRNFSPFCDAVLRNGTGITLIKSKCGRFISAQAALPTDEELEIVKADYDSAIAKYKSKLT